MNVIDTTGMSREQWLALRRQSIGASDAPVIAGLSKYKSRFALWLEKTGQSEPEEAGEEAWWGNHLEDPILGRLATLKMVDPSPLAQHQSQVMVRGDICPWMTATLDLVTECGQVWEFKACGIQTAKKLEDGNPRTLPDSWVLQAQHQMTIANVDVIRFAVFIGHRLQMYRFDVAWNAAISEGLIQLETEFRRHVIDRTPPTEFDASDAALLLKHYRSIEGEEIVSYDAELRELADQYEVATSRAKFQTELADQIKARLLAEMKTAPAMRVGPYRLRRTKVDVRAQEPKPRAAYSYTKFTFTNMESDE